MSQNHQWIALERLLAEALDSPCCADGAPASRQEREELATALADQLCRDVVVKDVPERPKRWWRR